MFIIDLLVFVIDILFIICVITQVMVPIFSGEPLFPFFRKSLVKEKIVVAEQHLETVSEEEHLKRVVDEINRRKAELEKE